MLLALTLLPLALAGLAFALPDNRRRPALVPIGAGLHLALTSWLVWAAPRRAPGAWLGADPLGELVLLQVSLLVFLCALYLPSYLSERAERDNRVFCSSVLVFLGIMSLAAVARHLGLMWVAIESATLAAAPLLYFDRNRRSIEATWKYLLIGSVGIALALLGSFFLAYGALYAGLDTTLLIDDMLREAPRLSKPWLHGALVFLFVGYGTKLGLAPMHTWKPDAYGEAPGVVGALLSGAMTSCAFLAMLRFYHVAEAAGEGAYARQLLWAFGLFSVFVAAVFLVRQRDLKRMLAYSSVEHMGLLALALGLGSPFAALYHMLTNAFTKGALFLAVGNIHRAFGSKVSGEVRGALRRAPVSAGLLVAGLLAILGAPPFGPFMSKLTLLQAGIAAGQHATVAAVLALLLVAMIGMGSTVFAVVGGEAPERRGDELEEHAGTLAPAFALIAVALLLGVFLPAPLDRLLRGAAAYLEAAP